MNEHPTVAGGSATRYVFILSGVLMAMFVVLFQWGFSYSGLVARMAEWQYARFAEWYPMLSVLSFCALAVLCWRATGLLRRRRRIATKKWSPDDERSYQIKLPRTSYLALYSLSAFCFALVLGALVYWFTLPGGGGSAVRIGQNNVAQIREGAVIIGNLQPAGPVVRYREAILDLGPTQYFAPVAVRRMQDGTTSEFTLFAELVDGKTGPRVPRGTVGIMRMNALPGDLVTLYRANGYAVSSSANVIFRSAASSSRGTLIFMLEALATGILFLIFGWFMRRRYRKTLDNLAAARSA